MIRDALRLFLVPVALVLFLVSIFVSTRAPRHETSHGEQVRQLSAIVLALWAIIVLLVDIALR